MKRFTATPTGGRCGTASRFITGIGAAALFLASSILAYGQDMEINPGSTFHGHGKYNVKGNIDNSADTAASPVLVIPGKISLVGTTGVQTVGSKGTLQTDTLEAAGTTSKILAIPTTVDSALDINNGAGQDLDVHGTTLTINGTAAKTSGALKADSSASVVHYAGATSQAVIDATYSTLQLSNAGAKSLAGPVTTNTITHSGGDLNVSDNLTVNGAATLLTVSNVAATKTLDLKGGGTVDSVGGNAGTISAGGGTTTIAKPLTSAGAINVAATAALTVQKAIHNTGTFTVAATGAATFSDTVNGGGTYTFDPASTATYDQAAGTQAVVPTSYGALVLKNTKKTAADSITLAGTLSLDSSLTMATGKTMAMTSATPANVSGTGQVIGKVKRSASFQVDSVYTFNGAHDALALDATTGAAEMALTLLPDSDIIAKPKARYVKRTYEFEHAGLGSSKIKQAVLSYADAEIQASANETRLGMQTYNNTSSKWSKLTASGYTHVDDAANNFVTVSNVAGNPDSVQQIGLMINSIASVASGSWNDSTKWDGGVPTITDDAEISATHNITVDADTSVATVALLDSTSTLTINTGSLAVSGQVDNPGTITVGNGTNAKSLHLVGATSHLVNNKKLVVKANATLQIDGKLKNFGDVTNDGVIDIGQ